MKKHEFLYKTIQLILYIILAGCCLYIILFDSRLYHLVASDPSIRLLCIFLWLTLGLSFIFIYRDFMFFSSYKSNYRELDFAVHSDPLSGLANRFSCDVMIEKYLDKPLPEDIACVMFDLTNIYMINQLYGHIQGNQVIKEFSDILRSSSTDLCFVGRNGGNKFLAVFENATKQNIITFLEKVKGKTQAYNQASSNCLSIEYKYGIAFHEGENVKMITDLIALSNQRIHQ